MPRRLDSGLGSRLGLAFLCLLTACGEGAQNAPPPVVAAREAAPGTEVAPQPAGKAQPIDYQREAATLDGAIDNAIRFIGQQPDNTLAAVETVSMYIERARLTGNYDDYGKAAALLDVAIAWTAARPSVASVIAGVTRAEQVDANVAAIATELAPDEIAEIDRITAPEAAG